MSKNISIIGASVIDVLAGAVDEKIFTVDGQDVDYIKTAFGGDALNEAVALSRLGKRVQLISNVGDDDAGQRILDYASTNGLDISGVTVQAGLETSIIVVLVDGRGERRFLMNPSGSMRKFALENILPHVDSFAPIVCLASMFISTTLDVPAMELLFSRIKASGRTLAVDMKPPKRGETLDDLTDVLSFADYFFPNEFELATLTGSSDLQQNIAALLACGVKCAVVKRGDKGCIIATTSAQIEIPACPVKQVVDTTGAGDSFAAGFLWALSEGWRLEDCGRFACAAASLSIEAVGAVNGVTSLAAVMARYEAAQ